MSFNCLQNWFASTAFGKYLSELERQFLQQKLSKLRFGTILQNGFPAWQFKDVFATEAQYIIQNNDYAEHTMLIADSLAMPWNDQCIDTLIWPHGIDEIVTDEQALTEAARILVPGGCILLTGLNNKGYWRFYYRRQANLKLWQPRSVANVVNKLKIHNLYLTEGHFLGYGVPGCYGTGHQTIEFMGNRWWPHLAAVYGLVFVKRNIPLTLIPNQLTKEKLDNDLLGVKIMPLCAKDQ
ncbi:MAG: hypothetical protein J6568_02855 [Snodgrassella sp.]|nr:hypothetical protein [Snodgrassella sp.]